jgi:hypothetical protein
LFTLADFLASCGLAAQTAAAERNVELARDAKPSRTIVIPEPTSPQEKNAAVELKVYLDRITGGSFLIATEAAKLDGRSIYVGATKAFAAEWPSLKPDALGKDGIILKTSSAGDLFITGRAPRGVLYAVYSFLEDFCGVRWWTPADEFVPSNANLSVRMPDLEYSPRMDYRDSFYFSFNGMEQVFPDDARMKFCVKLKNNGFFGGIPKEWGGNTVCLPGAWPTFSRLMPPDRYFSEHPDWYSELDGRRTTKQLCLSNREMRQEMARNVLAMIRATPGVDMVTITQNDTDGACQCSKCKAVDAQEDSPAGLLLQCVNEVAAEVEKEYPDLFVNTLAYAYNMKEPKITRPRKNVSVQICCPTESSRFDSPANQAFLTTLRAWTGMAKKSYAWTYLVDFGDMLNPIPNAFNLGPNIRIMADHNVSGVFAQGNSYAPIGDFCELKAWLVAKMLWDPSLDDKALIQEFLTAYYGAAAAPLHKYLELIAADCAQRQFELINHNAYADPPALTPWLSLDAMNRSTRLFDEAQQAVAANAGLLERVKKARAAIEFQWLIGWQQYRSQSQEQGLPFLGPQDQHEAYDRFMADCRRWKVSRLCEGNGSLNILHPAIFGKK